MKINRLILTGLIILSTSTPLSAATVSWNNLGSGLWSESAKWSPVIVPATIDDVVINYGTGTISADTTATVKTLRLGGGNKLTVSTGNLTLGADTPEGLMSYVDGNRYSADGRWCRI
jgi:hypothetical protein